MGPADPKSVADTGRRGSYFLDLGAAQDAGGQKDECDDEDGKCRDVLVLDAEIGGPENLDQADQQAAQYSARQAAYAAEHRGGECLYPSDEADKEIDCAVVQ